MFASVQKLILAGVGLVRMITLDIRIEKTEKELKTGATRIHNQILIFLVITALIVRFNK